MCATMHDTVVLFKIHEEHGRLINAADWYARFRDVQLGIGRRNARRAAAAAAAGAGAAAGGGGGGGDAAPSAEEEAELKARFFHAMKEMAWMGFVKTSTRQPDCVTRNVFDSVSLL